MMSWTRPSAELIYHWLVVPMRVRSASRGMRSAVGISIAMTQTPFAVSNEIVTSHMVTFSLRVTYPDPRDEGRIHEAS